MKRINGIVVALVLCATSGTVLRGQDSAKPDEGRQITTLYLKNAPDPTTQNEILTAMRLLMAPGIKLYLTPATHSISLDATPAQLLQAEKVIKDLDLPKKTYRVTYTIIDSDAGKRVGVQHFAMMVSDGSRTTLKQGSKVPIATGSFDEGKNGTQTQFTYLDVGLNFDATVDSFAEGVRLKSQVEQSSVTEDKTIAGVTEPIVRQSKLEGTSIVPLGKPTVLGAIDVPGTTRHLEIEVVVDFVK